MMSKKGKTLFLASSLAAITTCGIVALVGSNVVSLLRSENNGSDKLIRYHLADNADLGEVTTKSYRVTDPSNNYYYTGFVSKGTFSNDGLALKAGEFFQADLKGATGVTISFSSGSFAIELSNDNSNFTSFKYLSTGGTYNFKVLMRYVRVLCKGDGVLTDVNLNCACSDNYYFDTNASMSESVWNNNAKANKATLVGAHKGGEGADDFNYLTINTARDERGLYVYAREKVAGAYMSGNDWWENDDFEIRFNSTVATEGRSQLYASTFDNDHGNFDVVRVEKLNKQTGYDVWHTIIYKCFVTYETLTEMNGHTFDSNSDIFIWYGYQDGHSFNHCSSWDQSASVKATANGVVDLSGNRFGRNYAHNHAGWEDRSEWTVVSDPLNDGDRKAIAVDVHGATNSDATASINDVKWKTILPTFFTSGDKEKGRVFRMDWFSFTFGGFTDSNVANGSIWEYEAKCKGDDTRLRYYEVITNSDIVYVFNRSGNTYKVTTCFFPNNPAMVGRDDYILTQSLDTDAALGAGFTAEWTNYFTYNQ